MTPVRPLAGSLDALDTTGHRVSNSLATVSSLLALQELRAQSGAVRDALETARARVHAIATVHRHMVFDGKAEYASAPELIQALIETASQAQGNRDRVSVSASIQPMKLSARDANAVGLTVHELVTNALQHGFADGSSGTVTVSLLQDEAGVPVLEVRDNGTGGVDPSFAPTGLGSTIVKQLIAPLGGVPLYEAGSAMGLTVSMRLASLQNQPTPAFEEN